VLPVAAAACAGYAVLLRPRSGQMSLGSPVDQRETGHEPPSDPRFERNQSICRCQTHCRAPMLSATKGISLSQRQPWHRCKPRDSTVEGKASSRPRKDRSLKGIHAVIIQLGNCKSLARFCL